MTIKYMYDRSAMCAERCTNYRQKPVGETSYIEVAFCLLDDV